MGLVTGLFRLEKKTGSSYQYGYLKLNLSADADNLIIKSIAYCAVPDKTIYFGDY